MGDGNEVGLRFGLCSAMIALGGLGGPPVSGAINSATGGFLFVGVYAGMPTHNLVLLPTTDILRADRECYYTVHCPGCGCTILSQEKLLGKDLMRFRVYVRSYTAHCFDPVHGDMMYLLRLLHSRHILSIILES